MIRKPSDVIHVRWSPFPRVRAGRWQVSVSRLSTRGVLVSLTHDRKSWQFTFRRLVHRPWESR